MKKKKSRIAVIISSVLIFVSLAGILCFIGVYAFVRKNVDYSIDDAMFLSVQGHGSTKFFYDAGGGVGEYEPKEFCIYKGSNIKKQWFSYDKIGNNLKDAFISAEDRDFFIHNGVDFKRTAFAFLNYFLRVRDKFGGSTITQQVVKNISGDNKQTITRKLTEIFRAIHLENVHSKEEILEVYMNIVPMGEGILGVGLASNYYFGKSPSELSYAEAATLVGITNAPTRYNPKRNPDKCVKKRNIVLYAMLECGVINEAQYEEAINSELTIVDYQDENESVDSWFLETVCDDIVRDLAKEKGISESAARIIINNGGLSVYTTVNPDIQNFLEEYFEKEEHFPNSIN